MIAGVYIAVAMIISVPMTLFALACGGGFLLHEVIDKLRGELTMVIIAHRPSTIRLADLIVVLDHSRIVEKGRWQELMDLPKGRLRSMIRKYESSRRGPDGHKR